MNPRPAVPPAWNEFDSSIDRKAPPSPANDAADQDVPVAEADDVDADRLGRLRVLADRPRPEAPARAEEVDLEDDDAEQQADRDRALIEDRPEQPADDRQVRQLLRRDDLRELAGARRRCGRDQRCSGSP